MKKTLMVAILGLAAVVTARAQGSIVLYNYNSGKPVTITASAVPVSGASGFTAGFYWGLGDQTAAINTSAFIQDSTSTVFTGAYTPALTLFTGANGTSHIGTSVAGYFDDLSSGANLGVAGGTTVTIVVVAYNGSSYATSTLRGHSLAFTMIARGLPQIPYEVGAFMPAGFNIAVPEPSTFALLAAGIAGVWCFRRRTATA
ncbi:MAG: hypothetical protein RLY20_392 [Verrucomicrobiota bacterium]